MVAGEGYVCNTRIGANMCVCVCVRASVCDYSVEKYHCVYLSPLPACGAAVAV